MNKTKKEPLNAIAIIPIRGTDKFYNETIAGKTILARTIDNAKNATCITDVYVLTDNAEIEKHAAKAGAKPLLQDASISRKTLEEALQHAIITLRKQGVTPEIVFSLEITHPLRPAGLFDKMARIMQEGEFDTVLTVVKETDNFWKIAPDGGVKRLDEKSLRKEREPMFRELLGIGCATRADLIASGVRVGRSVGIVPIEPVYATIDVRTVEDIKLAEKFAK